MFVPPPWLTKRPDSHTFQRPMNVQVGVQLPGDANPGDQPDLMNAAQDIVNHNSNQLNRWIGTNRAFIQKSDQQYAQRRFRFDNMDATWTYNSGYEKLNLDVYPSPVKGGVPESSDTNTDGYVCWVHVDPFFPDNVVHQAVLQRTAPTPYNIFFNGYLIEQNLIIQNAVTGYPILFGKTALLCDSYTGSNKDGNKNPLVRETNLKQPNAMLPPNGWGEYKDGPGPDGITDQPSIPKTLGYWIFDWWNLHNPCQWGQFFSFGGSYQQLLPLLPPTADQTMYMSKGMYFKNSAGANGPLKTRGTNGMSVMLSPLSVTTGEEVNIYELFIAEFYDRGKYRKVKQSWQQHGKLIKANDSPLIYGAGVTYNGFGSGGGIQFNLDPDYTKAGPSGDDSLLGPHSGLQFASGQDDHVGLDQSEIATIDDWFNQCQQIIVPFQQQQKAKEAALLAQINDPTQQNKVLYAHEVAFIVRTFKGDATLFTASPDKFWPGDIANFYTDILNVKHLKAGGPVKWDPQAARQVVEWISTTIRNGSTTSTTDDYTYGQSQSYYLALPNISGSTQTTYAAHAYDGQLAGPPWIEPATMTTQVSDTTTGAGSDDVVRTVIYRIDNIAYPWLSNNNNFFGPSTYDGLVAQADDYIRGIMTPYELLIKQYDDVLNAIPPNLPDFPDLGKNLSDFGAENFSNISIDQIVTGDWEYKQ